MAGPAPKEIERWMVMFRSLQMDHPTRSHKDISIVGLDLKVFGLDEIKDNSLPIAALIVTHGRTLDEQSMIPFCHGVLGEVDGLAKKGRRRRDLIVVTFDHRNHGKRIKDMTWNLPFDKNPSHLVDMAATVTGAAQDLTLIIDFLAAYLFPNGERHIEEFMASGMSLGEPRIKIGVPMLGLPFPSMLKYLKPRAERLGFEYAPPILPTSILPIFEKETNMKGYNGKKILSLHGGADQMVPFREGEKDIEDVRRALKDGGGELEVWIQDGKGHVLSPEMVKKAAEWIWRWGLSVDRTPNARM